MTLADRALRWLLALGLGAVAPSGWAEDRQGLTDDEVTVRIEGRHRLLLPKDWPVEDRDGLLRPVSLEVYLSLKFGQVKVALDTVHRQLEAREPMERR